MGFKNHRSKADKNFSEIIKCLKERCGGAWKDPAFPWWYAHLRGLRVCAYDLNKVGSGFPDCEIWVSWLCMQFEVKQERIVKPEQNNAGQFKTQLTDEEYYRAQLEDTEVFYRLHHSSIVPIVFDRNQIFDWLNIMVDFVLYVEGKAEGSEELLRLFFPKITTNEQYNKD